MKSSVLIILIVLSLLIPFSAQSEWESNKYAYAKVIKAPEYLYTLPSFDDPGVAFANTLLAQEYFYVSERHQYLDIGSILRIKILDDIWAQIQPEHGKVNPYTYNTNGFVYIELQYLEIYDQNLDAINVFSDTKHSDKLIVVLRDEREILAFEGSNLVLKTPVVLGSTVTSIGDHRIAGKRITNDMTGIAAVGFAQRFNGPNILHASPWWNWRSKVKGHLGSHGCVNLPDSSWYMPKINDRPLSIAEWLFAWTNSGLNMDTDANIEEVGMSYSDPGWYEPYISTRVIVVNQIEDLHNYPTTNRLGSVVENSKINDWQDLISDYYQHDGSWLFPDIDKEKVEWNTPPMNMSVAQVLGEETPNEFVLINCENKSNWDSPVDSGASRTKGDICNHFKQDRPGSICTPERVDIDYFGRRVYCLEDRFTALHIETLIPLIEHENVHLVQFSSPILKQLYLQGYTVDDPTPGKLDITQRQSLGAWLELGAQLANEGSIFSNFYSFVLIGKNDKNVYNGNASTQSTMAFLHRECGDQTENDSEIHKMIANATLMDEKAYSQFVDQCGDPTELVVDYSR